MKAATRRMQVFWGEVFRVDREWRDALADAGVKPGRLWMKAVGDELVSFSPATRCFRTRLKDGRTVYFKRYVYQPKNWLEFWLRPGKAAVEVFAYQHLQQLGIPTLTPVAFGEYRVLGMLLGIFIVTPEVPDTVELRQFAVDSWYGMPEPQRSQVYRELSAKLVRQLQLAHQADFFHHDLKWRNILVRTDADGYTPVWIDAPRADVKRLRHARGVMVDLSGLARIAVSLLSVNQRMRFLCQYLGRGRSPGQAKSLFKQVAAHLGRRPPKPLELPARD